MVYNVEVKEKTKNENENVSEGYESHEDIERLIRVSVKNSQLNSREEENSLSIISNGKKENKKYNFGSNQNEGNLKIIRVMNSLSIFILFVTFFATSISKMNSNNYYLIMEYLRRDRIQAETNLMVLYIAFFFVIFSSILALLRNIINTKEKDFSHEDISTILSQHFKHFYYTGNILFSICLISNHSQTLQKYGVNCFLCVVTLILYFKAYYSHKTKLQNVKLDNLFNYISFSVNISFLLAWNVSYLTISIASCLSFYHIELTLLYSINLSLQILLSAFLILSLSYFLDIYFSFIILIFQIGNTLNKHMFNYSTLGKIDIKDDNNLNMIITLFSTICFLFSLYFILRLKKNKFSDELEELNKNYLYNKDKAPQL